MKRALSWVVKLGVMGVAAFAVVFAVGAFTSRGAAGEIPARYAIAAPSERPVKVAMFYSNFCSACHILDPRIQAAKNVLGDRAVEFIRFDQSLSAFQQAKLTQKAADEGLSAIWDDNAGATGFAVLVDASTSEPLGYFTIRDSAFDIASAIDAALRRPVDPQV